MKRLFFTALLFFILTANSFDTVFAADLYEIDIAVSGTQAHKAIALTPEIINKAGSSALRIINRESREEIPFFIHSATEETEVETIFVPFSFVGEFTRDDFYYIDFEASSSMLIDPMVTHIHLEAPQEEFLKNITVLGSYDGQHWVEITSSLVYIVSDVEQNEIALGGVHRYHFYRLKVPTPQEYIDFRAHGTLELGRSEQIPFTISAEAVFEADSANGITTVTLLGIAGSEATMENLRITGIHIETDSVFKRDVSVNNRTITLHRLSFHGQELANTFIPLAGHPQSASFSFRIFDYDDRPISISRLIVEYTAYYLVFRAEEEYSLIFGGNLERPRYDMDNFRDLIIQEGYDRVYFTGQARLIGTEYIHEARDYQWLFNGAIVLAGVLLTGIAAASFIKSLRKPH